MIKELSSIPGVESVEPNDVYPTNREPNDDFYQRNLLWGMGNIGMPSVWDYITGSNSICVAVFDTGIDYNHPDLSTNMAIDSYGNHGRRFYNVGSVGNDPMDIDSADGHGTHVAGTIGAIGNNNVGVVGVNWNVKMLAVNVFSTNTSIGLGAERADILSGITYVLSEKEKGLNIRVANMSFGSLRDIMSDTSTYGLAIKSLSDAGIICVMSAGNDSANLNTNTQRHYPSSFRFDNTLAVGSITSSKSRSSFSNYGSNWVDIAAPGSAIYSTRPNNRYQYMSGTSMSAPHVTGAAALLCAAYPDESATQIKERILRGADSSVGVSNNLWANGILDVWKAYRIPVITTTELPSGTLNSHYSQTLNANGLASITWSLVSGSLPTGLSLSGTGVINGYPTAMGTYDFTVKATNTAGNVTKDLSITVNGLPPVIMITSFDDGYVGIDYAKQLWVTGAYPISWSVVSGSLPNGLYINKNWTGFLVGTPITSGPYNFTLKATNSAGSDTKAFSLVVNPAVAPVITTAALPGGYLGLSYYETLTATGTAPMTWSITSGNLPSGLSLNGSSGVISGTPTANGTYDFTVRASNAAGNVSKNLSIVVTSSTALVGGYVEINGVSYEDGDHVLQCDATGTIRFVPIPANAVLNSVEWGSDSLYFDDPDLIETEVSGAEALGQNDSIWVSVNGSFFMELTVWVEPSDARK